MNEKEIYSKFQIECGFEEIEFEYGKELLLFKIYLYKYQIRECLKQIKIALGWK